MKNALTILGLFTFSISSLIAQTLPFDTETGRIIFTEVVYINDSTRTKDELYSIAREWFAKSFKDSQNVLQMEDKAFGKLIGKGSAVIQKTSFLGESNVDFTISIYLKDGRYKYVIADLNHVYPNGSVYGGALEDDKPDCSGFTMMKKGWVQVKEQTESAINSLINDLIITMNKKTDNASDDEW